MHSLQPFRSTNEYFAWLFSVIGGLHAELAERDRREERRKADRLSEVLSGTGGKRKPREVNPETRAAQVEELARTMFEGVWPNGNWRGVGTLANRYRIGARRLVESGWTKADSNA